MRKQNIRKRTKQDGTPVYEARWRDAGGKERQKTFYTKKAAEDFQAQRKAAITKGKQRDESLGSLSFADYAERWLAHMETRNTRPVTIAGYRRYLDKYAIPRLGKMKVDRITSSTMLAYLRELSDHKTRGGYGLSPATIKHGFIPVRATLKFAVLEEAIATNPAVGIPLPERNTAPRPTEFKRRPVTPKALKLIADALDSRDPTHLDSLVLAFLAKTGVRAAELAGLEIQDCDLTPFTRRVNIIRTKTRKYPKPAPDQPALIVTGAPKSPESIRSIDLPSGLAAELRAYLDTIHPNANDPQAPLFPARATAGGSGNRSAATIGKSKHAPKHDTTADPNPLTAFDWSKPINPDTYLQRRLRPALRQAAKANPSANPSIDPLTRLHDLRHSYGTNLALAGASAEDICRLMGHSSLFFTFKTYIHNKSADRTAVVDLLDDSPLPAPTVLHDRDRSNSDPAQDAG